MEGKNNLQVPNRIVNAIVVLGHKKHKLTAEHKKRLDRSIDYLHKGISGYVVVHGKKAKDYLEKKGVGIDHIIIQEKSKDTIGEIYFIKKEILSPKRWKKILVISSDYHIRYRVRLLFDYILGKEYTIIYDEVKTNKINDRAIIKDQIRSLYLALSLFNGRTIEEGMKNHPLYKK